jgi:hypothetical protein
MRALLALGNGCWFEQGASDTLRPLRRSGEVISVSQFRLCARQKLCPEKITPAAAGSGNAASRKQIKPRQGRHICRNRIPKNFQAPSGAAYSARPPDDVAPTELVISMKRKATNMPRLRRFAFMATGGE